MGGALFAARAPVAAVPITALAALFAVQAGRVRFTFDDEAFELKTTSTDSEELKDSGENIVVGGANRWITFPCQLHQCLQMGWKDCVMDSEIPHRWMYRSRSHMFCIVLRLPITKTKSGGNMIRG